MSSILNSIGGAGKWLQQSAMSVVDRLFPPAKRAEFIEKLKSFALGNPKLAVCSSLQPSPRS